MQKRDRKLQLNRETVRQLDSRDLAKANGGVAWTGCDSACTECGGTIGKFTLPQDQEPIFLAN